MLPLVCSAQIFAVSPARRYWISTRTRGLNESPFDRKAGFDWVANGAVKVWAFYQFVHDSTGRGGNFTDSQPACLFFNKFCKISQKDLRYFSKILQNRENFDTHLRFAAIPAKFYENRVENDGFE